MFRVLPKDLIEFSLVLKARMHELASSVLQMLKKYFFVIKRAIPEAVKTLG